MRDKGFSWGAAAAGAVAMLLLLVIIVAVLIFSGRVPVAASGSDPAAFSAVVHSTMERSVKRKASGLRPPQLAQGDLLEGASHYKTMCQQCHGGPGAEPDEFASGLNPRPPDLTGEEAKEWSQAQIFWIAKHGIRMTAMPAFGSTHSDQDLWRIAAFVKRLPKVSAAEYASYPAEEEGHSGGAGHHHD